MSAQLPSHYVTQFASNIQLLLQQNGSLLRPLVMTGSHKGKQASPVDQIGAVNAQRKNGRFQPMGRVDAPVDRRWVFPVDYDLPQLVDHQDELRMVLDPKSALVQNAQMAMGRAIDDEIITAFFADAKTGEAGGSTTSFTAGNIIAHGSAGLTVAKLRAAKKILLANQVKTQEDPIYAVITAAQHDNLLAEATIISTDFNDKPVLVDGMVTRFLGINFILCERLPVNGSSHRRIPMFAKSGMYLGMWADIKTSITQRDDLQGLPWQAYCEGTFGATRLEEKKVIEIPCVES